MSITTNRMTDRIKGTSQIRIKLSDKGKET